MSIEKLRELIGKNEIQYAIECLILFINENEGFLEYLNIVLIRQGNFKENELAKRTGTISHTEYIQIKNQIVSAILDTLNDIKKSPHYIELIVENKNYSAQVAKIDDKRVNITSIKEHEYIFVFGTVASGKTTLLSSIAYYIQNSKNYRIHYNPNDKEGFPLITKGIESLRRGDFPSRTGVGNIFEIDIGWENISSGVIYPITFIESAGEDLQAVKLDWDEYKTSPIVLENLIKEGNTVLLIVDALNAQKDDYICVSFLNYVFSKKNRVNVGIVIMQWDKLKDKNILIEDFVKRNMPITSRYISNNRVQEHSIFSFSALDIFEKGDFSATNNIINWLSVISNEYSKKTTMKSESSAIIQKIKKLFSA